MGDEDNTSSARVMVVGEKAEREKYIEGRRVDHMRNN